MQPPMRRKGVTACVPHVLVVFFFMLSFLYPLHSISKSNLNSFSFIFLRVFENCEDALAFYSHCTLFFPRPICFIRLSSWGSWRWVTIDFKGSSNNTRKEEYSPV